MSATRPAKLTDAQVQEVLGFWFGAPDDGLRGAWFEKNAAFDAEIRVRFATWIDALLAQPVADAVQLGARGSLAQLVLLDQFTRNAYRDTPRAFAGDAHALTLARAALAAGLDRQLTTRERVFVYLPLEHAESLALQEESVRLFGGLAAEDPKLADYLRYAVAHRDVVARFGRFPHRNAVLERTSTPAELAFLATPGSRF